MALQQLVIGHPFQSCHRLVVFLRRIAADVVVVQVVGGCHDIERCRRGVLHAAPALHSVALYPDAAFGCQSTFHTLLLHVLHRYSQPVVSGLDVMLQLGVEIHVK